MRPAALAAARRHSRCCAAPPLLLLLVYTSLGTAPLAGRICMPAEERFVESATVERAVATSQNVLQGEAHPVARHPPLQARLLRTAARQRDPAHGTAAAG